MREAASGANRRNLAAQAKLLSTTQRGGKSIKSAFGLVVFDDL